MAECLLCSDNVFLTILASLLWLVLIGWVFCGLAIVADDYLVPALEKLGDYFKIPPNVAAATFLAFGSAVPEIMTSIVSTIRGKVDASLPAILGSGCIAYSLIPAACVLGIQPFLMTLDDRRRLLACENTTSDLAKHYLEKDRPAKDNRFRRRSEAGRLRTNSMVDQVARTFSPALERTRSRSSSGAGKRKIKRDVDTFDFLPLRLATKPLIRDIGTYIVALTLTILFIQDTQMELWESSVLLLLYVAYIVVLIVFKDFWDDEGDDQQGDQALDSTVTQPLLPDTTADSYTVVKTTKFTVGTPRDDDLEKNESNANAEAAADSTEKKDENAASSEDTEAKDEAAPAKDKVVPAAAADGVGKNEGTDEGRQADHTADAEEAAGEGEDGAGEEAAMDVRPEVPAEESGTLVAEAEAVSAGEGVSSSGGTGMGSGSGSITAGATEEAGDDDDEVDTPLIFLIANAPFYFIFGYTIPDVTHEDWEDVCWVAPVSFVICVAYVGALAFLTLFLVTQLCLTFDLPESVSGVTLIALGAEIPDTVGSMALAKVSQGSAAVSNALNSQIINLLVGLGLPYLLSNIIHGEPMDLGEAGSTQMFIGILLAGIVCAFVWFTLGEALCYQRTAMLTWVHGVSLLVVYTGVVIAISIWAEEEE